METQTVLKRVTDGHTDGWMDTQTDGHMTKGHCHFMAGV